jgi:hypothetical protein
MEQFTQLFGRLLALVYHCFDRIVILGHLPLLTRPENIVHFFRDVHGVRAITKEVLREPTDGASSTCSPHETSEGGILRAKPQESNPRGSSGFRVGARSKGHGARRAPTAVMLLDHAPLSRVQALTMLSVRPLRVRNLDQFEHPIFRTAIGVPPLVSSLPAAGGNTCPRLEGLRVGIQWRHPHDSRKSHPRNGRSAPRRYAHHGRLWGGGDLGE